MQEQLKKSLIEFLNNPIIPLYLRRTEEEIKALKENILENTINSYRSGKGYENQEMDQKRLYVIEMVYHDILKGYESLKRLEDNPSDPEALKELNFYINFLLKNDN